MASYFVHSYTAEFSNGQHASTGRRGVAEQKVSPIGETSSGSSTDDPLAGHLIVRG